MREGNGRDVIYDWDDEDELSPGQEGLKWRGLGSSST
jgi:hypothetical protein